MVYLTDDDYSGTAPNDLTPPPNPHDRGCVSCCQLEDHLEAGYCISVFYRLAGSNNTL